MIDEVLKNDKDLSNEEIAELAQKNKLTVEECYDKLRKWYDGYHFSPDLSLPGMYSRWQIPK